MSKESFLNYGLDQYKEKISVAPNEGIVIVTREKYLPGFEQVFNDSELPASIITQNDGEFKLTSRSSSSQSLLILAEDTNIMGTISAAANAMRMIRWYEDATGFKFDKSSVLLSGGRSTRNLGLAPLGNKGLITLPNDESLIELGIKKMKQFSDNISNGTLIMACDEVIVLGNPPEIDQDRFTIIGGELPANDQYLPLCGCCEIDSQNGKLINFYEKRPHAELMSIFKQKEHIPVSWGGYYVPYALEDAFSEMFSTEYGEFSRIIEAAYVNLDDWLIRNPGYDEKTWQAARSWHRMNDGFGFANSGPDAYFKHIGSNREFHDFCQQLFQDETTKNLLNANPTPDSVLVSPSASISGNVQVGKEVIVYNKSQIRDGRLGSNSVVTNSDIKGEIGDRSLVANTTGEVNLPPSTFHSSVITSKGNRKITFPLDTDIKSRKDLLDIALDQ